MGDYFAPYIDETGPHYPPYADIRDYLLAQFQAIYGSDQYIGEDSAIYQFISINALAKYDSILAWLQAYNDRNPQTASGVGVDVAMAYNGIVRKSASYSSSDVTLTGTPGAVITNGIVQDDSGNKWDLPTPLTIGGGGTLTVTAVCEETGAIQAAIGTITTIVTPQQGWTSVTNAAAAVAGQPVETDAQAKARRAASVALPSSTLIQGTEAAIAGIEGVTRYKVYENPTADNPDSNGLISHSIEAVVEGGDQTEIAWAIKNNKGPGCGMNGSTSVVLTIDAVHGITETIKYQKVAYTPIYVVASLTLLGGYTSDMAASIQAAIVAYLNSLQIGESVTWSALFAVAMAVTPDILNPAFSITALTFGTTSTPTTTTDVAIAIDHVSQGLTNHVTVNIPS